MSMIGFNAKSPFYQNLNQGFVVVTLTIMNVRTNNAPNAAAMDIVDQTGAAICSVGPGTCCTISFYLAPGSKLESSNNDGQYQFENIAVY